VLSLLVFQNSLYLVGFDLASVGMPDEHRSFGCTVKSKTLEIFDQFVDTILNPSIPKVFRANRDEKS
jgi:hypothetical protein